MVTQARKFYGLKEIVGKDNNKIIIQFFKETGGEGKRQKILEEKIQTEQKLKQKNRTFF